MFDLGKHPDQLPLNSERGAAVSTQETCTSEAEASWPTTSEAQAHAPAADVDSDASADVDSGMDSGMDNFIFTCVQKMPVSAPLSFSFAICSKY